MPVMSYFSQMLSIGRKRMRDWMILAGCYFAFTPRSILGRLASVILRDVPELDARQYIWRNGDRRHTMGWDGRFVRCVFLLSRCKRCFACFPFSSALVLLSFLCDWKVRKYCASAVLLCSMSRITYKNRSFPLICANYPLNFVAMIKKNKHAGSTITSGRCAMEALKIILPERNTRKQKKNFQSQNVSDQSCTGITFERKICRS